MRVKRVALVAFFIFLAFSVSSIGIIKEKNQDTFENKPFLDITALAQLSPWHDKKVIVLGDTLISNYAYPNETRLKTNVKTLSSMAQKTNVPVFIAIPPRKLDVLAINLIEDYPDLFAERIYTLSAASATESGAEYIDIRTPLLESELDYIYMKTDHHWTSSGAYVAYSTIISAMGEAPYEFSDFEKEIVCDDFYGSDHSKISVSVPPDSIELLHLKNDTNKYTVTIRNYPYDSNENDRVIDGFYDMSFLDTDNKYNVFLSGVNANIKVTSNSDERETLLVLCDSFGLALAPFLALHYDLVLLDVRYYMSRISDVMEADNISKVLILENMGSLCEQTIKIIY